MSQKDKIMFPIIYTLHYKPSSECEFFKVLEREGYYIGWCGVLERPVVKSSIYKCERYWQTCPFRRSAQALPS
jgi:hypothetical protein